MLENLELLSLLLPEELRDKLALLDDSLTPEEQFNGFMELIKDETGLEMQFDKNKSLRENLQPILNQMSITERVGANKMLKFVEDKIEDNKKKINEQKMLREKEGEVDDKGQQSAYVDTSSNPDLIYFK